MKEIIRSRLFGILIIILSSIGILVPFFKDLDIFIDGMPWMIGFIIYPLPILLLSIYEGYATPLSDFCFFISGRTIILIYYLLLLITGIYLIKSKQWAKKLFIKFIIINMILGAALSILLKFTLIIPIYILIYGLLLWRFTKE